MLTLFIASLIFIALYGCMFVLSFCFLANSRARLYATNKGKGNFIQYIAFIALVVLFLVIAILSLFTENDVQQWIKIGTRISSWLLVGIAIIHLVLIIVLNTKINRKKIKVDNFNNEDFDNLLAKFKKPSEQYLQKFIKSNQRYISSVDSQYKQINETMDSENATFEFLFSSIIIFNEFSTNKCSIARNYYAIDKCISLLKKLQSKKLLDSNKQENKPVN